MYLCDLPTQFFYILEEYHEVFHPLDDICTAVQTGLASLIFDWFGTMWQRARAQVKPVW